ncbi:MAG: hypothetical protein MZU97_01575 [Bacillus subtilis]|nr:hypothetical protein [Bacillus subtilis]
MLSPCRKPGRQAQSDRDEHGPPGVCETRLRSARRVQEPRPQGMAQILLGPDVCDEFGDRHRHAAAGGGRDRRLQSGTSSSSSNYPRLSGDIAELIVIGFAAFCIAMVYTPAVSLSLEGKAFWIVKSLPARAQESHGREDRLQPPPASSGRPRRRRCLIMAIALELPALSAIGRPAVRRRVRGVGCRLRVRLHQPAAAGILGLDQARSKSSSKAWPPSSRSSDRSA